MDINNVLAEMGEIMDQLASLPDDAFGERHRLRQRQKELRSIAADLREGTPVDRQSLQSELEQLLERWDALQKERIDVVMQSGGGSQGGDAFSGAHAAQVNRQIDAARGRAELEARIGEIRRLLDKAE